MTARLLVLLPPSQGKSTGGRRHARVGVFDATLNDARQRVLAALGDFVATASPRQLELALNATGDLLRRALVATHEVVRGEAPLLPAWRRYQGVVWQHLDPASLSCAARRRVLVPSGLYGLLSGEDPIAEYRLKMNVRLAPLPSMARFWRPQLTAALQDYAKRSIIVNLLPQEHAASIDFGALRSSHVVVQARFVAHDEERAVGHDAKAIKGVIARHVLEHGLREVESVTWQGWRVRREGDDLVVLAPALVSRDAEQPSPTVEA